MKPNFAFLFIMSLIVTFGSINLGYTVVYYNSCLGLLNDQMGWTGDKADLYNAIINGIPFCGQLIGSLIGPSIMSKMSKR